jgi:hypothetical protein
MYGIRTLTGNQWEIHDDSGHARFRGTMRQCEDWLDLLDNTQCCTRASTAAKTRAPIAWRTMLAGLFWATTVSVGLYLYFAYQATVA